MDYFGGRNVSGIIGVLYHQRQLLGTLLGPSAAGFAFDISRSYMPPISRQRGRHRHCRWDHDGHGEAVGRRGGGSDMSGGGRILHRRAGRKPAGFARLRMGRCATGVCARALQRSPAASGTDRISPCGDDCRSCRQRLWLRLHQGPSDDADWITPPPNSTPISSAPRARAASYAKRISCTPAAPRRCGMRR